MNTIRTWITSKEPVMAAAIASGLVAVAARFGFHPDPTVLALIGAVSTIVLNLLARTKVTPVAATFIGKLDEALGVHADGTIGPAEPSVAGSAAVGGAAGGAAGAAAGGAVGGALGSVLGAITGMFNRRKP